MIKTLSIMNRPAERPLLPQTSAANFQFATPDLGAGYSKKNYVFVDEHNRHKRLKVMRACEGCRRRKIKCDAATTNSWPCAACVRLKLQCIPPTVNYARSASDTSASGLERVLDFDSSDASGDEGYMPQPPMTSYSMGGQIADFSNGSPYHQLHSRPSMPHMRHRSATSVSSSSNDTNFHTGQSYRPIPSSHPIQMPQRQDTWPGTAPPATSPPAGSNLSEALGELKIDEAGVAPYIYGQKKKLAEAPALEEQEMEIPIRPGGTGTVRIPMELMPNDLVAQEYFEIFFREVHPYIPVISKSYFYSQWANNRRSISPLLLEAIFACAGRLSDSDPASGASWLALAAKHETCFMDVPRLSTLQALIILMKAREASPKRGYYYRSWMTVKTLVEMGKDLELDQHYSEHQSGHGCTSDRTHCVVKTRIWQSIFIIEQMIGGPQARYDYSVSLDTVDFNVPAPHETIEHEEYEVSYNYTFMARCIRNVRYLTDVYAPIRKTKNWASDPAFVALNVQVPKFQDELPANLQIQCPADGSAPWIPDHYTANMHCYYHLSMLLLRRPQLMAASNFGSSTGEWRQHLSVCYATAKMMCRIQESLYQNYGMTGLTSMNRGVNFTVYCILACVMVHLVALTSPDPEFNSDARDYLTRHMRLLETCMNAAPMKDIQEQIQSLREAFSLDTNKPFELRPDIANQSRMMMTQQQMVGSPMHSPIDPGRQSYQPQLRLQISQAQPQQILVAHSLPVTPISNHAEDLKDGSMAAASLTMMAASVHPNSGQVLPHQQLSPPDTISGHYGNDATFEDVTATGNEDGVAWNPTPIFDQWQAAFGTPASSVTNSFPNAGGIGAEQHSPTLYSQNGSATGHDHDTVQQYSSMPAPPIPTSGVTGAGNYQPAHPFVSPNMWQEAVGQAYNSNPLKRRWDE